MVGLICHTKDRVGSGVPSTRDRVGSLEILVSRELQTGSTGVTVEAVPEREVSCLSLELQTCLLQSAVALYWSWWFLACRGSCKLGLLQLAVALVLVDGKSCVANCRSERSFRFGRYSSLCFERVPDLCRPILVT